MIAEVRVCLLLPCTCQSAFLFPPHPFLLLVLAGQHEAAAQGWERRNISAVPENSFSTCRSC